jgi:hypothetical protein
MTIKEPHLKAQTIDQVLDHLDTIIQEATDTKSRWGYFAALYRKVTLAVKKGIEAGLFDDGERMERLDVIFANRYLEAFDLFRNSGKTTLSWKLSFDATQIWHPTVLQHLFLGMNAHIDLDLGVAAAQTMEGQELATLQPDFNRINQILTTLLNEVQQDLAEVWPLLKFFDLAAGDMDETLSRFGIELSRHRAWRVAQDLAARPSSEINARILELDKETSKLGKMILHPRRGLQTILLIIRLGEIGSVPKIISILND